MTDEQFNSLTEDQKKIIEEYKSLPLSGTSCDDRSARRRDYVIREYNKIMKIVSTSHRFHNKHSVYCCDERKGYSWC